MPHARHAGAEDGEGVYVVAARPEERFKAAADLMRK